MSSALLAVLLILSAAPADPPATLKGVLLEQLKTTHDQKDWFASAKEAVEGVTAEQANWRDGKGNHSIGQLTAHLVFWNRQQLAKFKGEKPADFSGDNNETFNRFDAAKWTATVKELDEVMTALEQVVKTADEASLQKWASALAHIGAHNAYHIGQMVYVRRLQGSWDPEKGVK
jgi:uncharacterized damage-inducible protein DinB